MKVIRSEDEVRGVELTRRNLEALLKKLNYNRHLDQSPGRSLCTIEKGGVFIRAVEDEEHYSDRDPGVMLNNESGELY